MQNFFVVVVLVHSGVKHVVSLRMLMHVSLGGCRGPPDSPYGASPVFVLKWFGTKERQSLVVIHLFIQNCAPTGIVKKFVIGSKHPYEANGNFPHEV